MIKWIITIIFLMAIALAIYAFNSNDEVFSSPNVNSINISDSSQEAIPADSKSVEGASIVDEENTESINFVEPRINSKKTLINDESENFEDSPITEDLSITSNSNDELRYRSLEMMADLIHDIPLPAITTEDINKNAEIIESGKVPKHCKPRPSYDKCESVFPRLPDEENLLWREEMRGTLIYLISMYIQDKDIELLGVTCNHLICEILVSINQNMGDMHVVSSQLYAHLYHNQSLNIVDLDFGITPHGNPSDTLKDVYYQYYFLVFGK